MRKKVIAGNVIKLLKQGYSPKEVTQRMAVSYNYAWKLKKDLEKAAKELFTPEAGEYVVVEGAKSAQEVDAILNQRATTYGAFKYVAEIAQEIKDIVRVADTNRDELLAFDQREALDMIASKIGRILGGDSNYVDSWIDIAGYATLVADRLQGKTR
jgi:hypothetical protein